jgi:hypothetical protein
MTSTPEQHITKKPVKAVGAASYVLSWTLRLSGLLLFSIGFPISWLPHTLFRIIGAFMTGLGVSVIEAGLLEVYRDAGTILRADKRKHILYLRAFRNTGASAADIKAPLYLLPILSFVSDEQRIARTMNQVGPFVAIAEIGESPIDVGAARFRFDDSVWKHNVIELMEKAQIVVLRLDPEQEQWGFWWSKNNKTDLIHNILQEPDMPKSTWWEVEQVFNRVKPERILIYLPFKGRKSYRNEVYESIRKQLAPYLKTLETYQDKNMPSEIDNARFISFKADGTPYPLKKKLPSFLGVYNWYAHALKPFFEQLGVKPARPNIDVFRVFELCLGVVTTLLYVGALLTAITFPFRDRGTPKQNF